jgi:hypothetical protein
LEEEEEEEEEEKLLYRVGLSVRQVTETMDIRIVTACEPVSHTLMSTSVQFTQSNLSCGSCMFTKIKIDWVEVR